MDSGDLFMFDVWLSKESDAETGTACAFVGCSCLWTVCLEGKAMHWVIPFTAFPSQRSQSWRCSTLHYQGLSWPRWRCKTCWKGLLPLSLQTVTLELQVPSPLWHSCCPCRLRWTWYLCSVCGQTLPQRWKEKRITLSITKSYSGPLICLNPQVLLLI